MPAVPACSKVEVVGASVCGLWECGVEGDGEDGGPAIDGVGEVLWGAWCFSGWGSFSFRESIG